MTMTPTAADGATIIELGDCWSLEISPAWASDPDGVTNITPQVYFMLRDQLLDNDPDDEDCCHRRIELFLDEATVARITAGLHLAFHAAREHMPDRLPGVGPTLTLVPAGEDR